MKTLPKKRPGVRLPLYPSAAKQWINCSGSPRVQFLSRRLKELDSIYAAEGKYAHAYLEALLTAPSAWATEVSDQMKRLVRSRFPEISDEERKLIEAIGDEIYFLKMIGNYELVVEKKFPIKLAGSIQNPKIDILLIRPDHAMVIDFKWGAGEKVRVYKNEQLMLYGLAVSAYYPGTTIEIGIYQPRGIGSGSLDKWTPTKEDWLDFAIKANAAAERSYEPDVCYTPGDHCKWCPGQRMGLCPTLLSTAIDLSIEALDREIIKAPKGSQYKWALDCNATESPWWVLSYESNIIKLLSAVGERADALLRMGIDVPGWRLDSGEGKARWNDKDRVSAELAAKLGGTQEDYETPLPPRPMGITDAKKIAKKKGVSIDALFSKPTVFKRIPDRGKPKAVVPAIK